MGWRTAVLAGAAGWLLLGTGCLEDHRKGGTFDRAMRKDTRDHRIRKHEVVTDEEEEEEEEEPICLEGQVAEWKCEAETCQWVCK